MNKWSILLLVVVISCVKGQNINSWCPYIASSMEKCKDEYVRNVLDDFSRVFPDASSVMSAQALTSEALSFICQKSTLPLFEKFYDCIYGKLFACIPRKWSKVFPDVDNAKAQINYMCQNRQDIDTVCIASEERQSELQACQKRIAPNIVAEASSVDDYVELVCKIYPKTATCYWTTYGSCPNKTAEVLAKSVEFMTPIACDACISKPSPFLLITFFIMFYVSK